MTLTAQIRNALDGIRVIPEHFIPCRAKYSCKVMAKKEAKARGINIIVLPVQGGIIIKRVDA
jgi:hypothetical protein